MTMQQCCRALAAIALLAAAPFADAQQVSTRRPATTPRAQRERILIRIDSLMYEFDHAPLSAEESESLRVEMVRAMRSIEPGMMAFGDNDDMAPQGYLGVTFDGPSVELPRPNERVIRFLDYPRVSMVEPGSPAERGGVAQGDTLVALNGLDVKDKDVSLTRILVPAKRI
ncbi:MAG: PDZ domain-containing protein, partial [Solirubrobacteraceae bacterium]